MLQADPENAPEKIPANPPFIKPKVLVDATKLTPNHQILFSFGDWIMKWNVFHLKVAFFTIMTTYLLLEILANFTTVLASDRGLCRVETILVLLQAIMGQFIFFS
jgi:hypothetical protein